MQVTPAAGFVVVDYAYCLEECVNDRASNKLHSPALQISRNTVRQFGAGTDLIIYIQNDLTIGKRQEVAV